MIVSLMGSVAFPNENPPNKFYNNFIKEELICVVAVWVEHNVVTVRPRGTRSMCPRMSCVSRNCFSSGLLLLSRVSK